MRTIKMNIRTAVVAVATVAMAATAGAQSFELRRNALPLGEQTIAIARAGVTNAQRTGNSYGVMLLNGLQWQLLTSTAGEAEATFDVDSLSFGTGKFRVRAATPSGPSPAFTLRVSAAPCEGDYMLQVTSASGPGELVRGEGGSWVARFAFTACRNMTNVKLRVGGYAISILEQLDQPLYTYNGRSIRNQILLGSIDAGTTRTFEIGISGKAPHSMNYRFEIAPQWTIEHGSGRNARTDYLLESITGDLR